jgi:hypothetical protein
MNEDENTTTTTTISTLAEKDLTEKPIPWRAILTR